MKSIPSLILTLAMSVTIFSPSSSEAGAREDIIRLTHKLEDSTAILQQQFNAHYRGTREYSALIGCIRSLNGKAQHIHGLAHESVGAARELRSDVKSMDATVHRIHDYLDRVEAGGRRTGGSSCTKQVHAELSKITRTLHQLEGLATLRIQRSNDRQAARQIVPAPLNPLQHNSSYYHPHYGTGNRNLGNLVFPNQSTYSQSGQHSDRNSYSHQYYGNRGSSYSNRGAYRQPSTSSQSNRYSSSQSNRYGYSSSRNQNSQSSRHSSSNRSSGSNYSSNRGTQQPIDPARAIFESIFRSLQQR